MKLRVCFVAYHAYPAIEPKAQGSYGGTETRAWLLARGLARCDDMSVSFAVRTPRRLEQDEYDGVRIIRRKDFVESVRNRVSERCEILPEYPWVRIHRWTPSLLWQIPLLASLRPLRRRLPALWRPDRFYHRLPIDVFCCFGVHSHTAEAINACKSSGQKSVLFLGANSDLDPRYTADSNYVTPYGERGSVCWYALKQADRIVAQTPWQQHTLKERFGRDSVLLRNPIDVAKWVAAMAKCEPLPEALGLGPYALWIGRADDFHKRPLLCLELARRCPELPFLMLLNRRDNAIERKVRELRPANVRIVEQVAFSQMPAVFRQAAVYVNTSSAAWEGFPNAFLQAAASAIPIASLETDYDFIARERCGVVAEGDLGRLAEYLRAVWEDPERRQQEGLRGRTYVQQNHDLNRLSQRLRDALRETASP